MLQQQRKLCHDSSLQPAEKKLKTHTRKCIQLHKKGKMIVMYTLIREAESTAPQKELHQKRSKRLRSQRSLCTRLFSPMQKLWPVLLAPPLVTSASCKLKVQS